MCGSKLTIPSWIMNVLLHCVRVIFIPFYWLADRHQLQRETRVPRPSHISKRLSRISSRKRRLILPASQLIRSQPHATLLTRIPPELRLQIWRECLGGRSLELTVRQGKLTVESPPIISRRPFNRIDQDSEKVSGQNPASPLLRTCRQIYSESVDILYSDNAFYTAADYLPLIKSDIIPQHQRSIRILNITFLGDTLNDLYRDSLWNKWDDSLSGMTGLKIIHIAIDMPFIWRSHGIHYQRELLLFFRDLKCRDALRLTFPWDVDDPNNYDENAFSVIDHAKLIRLIEQVASE